MDKPQSVYNIILSLESGKKLSDKEVTEYLELLKSQYPDLAIADPKVDQNKFSFKIGSIVSSLRDDEVSDRISTFIKNYSLKNVTFTIKPETASQATTSQATKSSDYAIEILNIRLAKGELTSSEYSELKKKIMT